MNHPSPEEGTRPRLVLAGPSGNIVHLATCKTVRRSAVITFTPTGPSSADLAKHIASSSLQTCSQCKPITRLAKWERFG